MVGLHQPISLPLSLLGRVLSVRTPGEPLGKVQQLMERIEQSSVPGVIPPARLQAVLAEGRGMRMALVGEDLPLPQTLPALEYERVDLSQISAEIFLGWCEQGDLLSQGRSSPQSVAATDFFLAGAGQTFKSESKTANKKWPSSLTQLALAWGLFVARVPHGMGRRKIRQCSTRVGKASAMTIKRRLELGHEAGLTGAHLKRVHRRNIENYLMARGYLTGYIVNFQITGQVNAAKYLERNLPSVMSCALEHGKVDYPSRVIHALPQIIRDIEDGIAQLERDGYPAAATTLHKYTASIISHALKHGQLDYPSQLIQALPDLSQDIEKGTPLKREGQAYAGLTFRNYFGLVIYRALSRAIRQSQRASLPNISSTAKRIERL